MKLSHNYSVYIPECFYDSYIGVTNDLEKRLGNMKPALILNGMHIQKDR
ncbi:MAG: hypothetical protein ABI834_00725 [Ginsengibacter sp.]